MHPKIMRFKTRMLASISNRQTATKDATRKKIS